MLIISENAEQCYLTNFYPNFFVISFTPTKITQGPSRAKTPWSRKQPSRSSIPTSGKAMTLHHCLTSCVERPETSHPGVLFLLCGKSDGVCVIRSPCLSCHTLSASLCYEEDPGSGSISLALLSASIGSTHFALQAGASKGSA
jgi:hypothetical protein